MTEESRNMSSLHPVILSGLLNDLQEGSITRIAGDPAFGTTVGAYVPPDHCAVCIFLRRGAAQDDALFTAAKGT